MKKTPFVKTPFVKTPFVKTPFVKTLFRFIGVSVLLLAFALFSCAGEPRKNSRPDWVDSPSAIPDLQHYVAATGAGPSRMAAESAAFANLAMSFGMAIEAEQVFSYIYRAGFEIEWELAIESGRTVNAAAVMNFLVAAEIREIWFDGENTYFASAVMRRSRAAQIYTDLITQNLSMIESLTNMTVAERNSIAGFARYSLAAAVADANISYANVLRVVGAPPVSGVRSGDQYRLAAAEVAANIPVTVAVEIRPGLDPAGRLANAFSSAVSETGLRTVSSGGGYTLEVRVNVMEEVFTGQQQFRFVNYEVSANFVNSATRLSQMPVFSINGRAGHATLVQAENLAIADAERQIAAEYGALLAAGLLNAFMRVLPAR